MEQLQELLCVAAVLHDLGLCHQILLQALACWEEVHIREEGVLQESLVTLTPFLAQT